MDRFPTLQAVGFECQMANGGSALEVTYLLHNGSDGELGVFNRIRGLRPDGTLDYSPDLCWVDLGEGDTVHLMKMALPLPPGVSAAGYSPPDVSRIPARGSLRETFRVPLPLRVCQPFKKALHRGEVVADRLASAAKAAVSIGVFAVGDDCRLISGHPAFPAVLSAFPPGPALSRQSVLSCEFLLDPPLVVLDYRGVAWT